MATWHSQVDSILDAEEFERSAPANINFVSQNIIDAMNNSGENSLGLSGKASFILFLMGHFRGNQQSARVKSTPIHGDQTPRRS